MAIVYNKKKIGSVRSFVKTYAKEDRPVNSLIIDKNAIKSNLSQVKAKASDLEIIADLTGDACGLGLMETAKLLRDEGIRSFAVWDSRDAQALRSAGFVEEKILVLRSTTDSDELRNLIDLGVVCTVGSYDAAVAINGVAEELKTVCEVQIKIDTGLGRYGFNETEMDKVSALYKYMPNLAIVGVFSSYAQSWRNNKLAELQYLAFKRVLDNLTSMGFETGVTHIADSAALFRHNFGRMDAVRIGTALTGRIRGISSLKKVGYIEADIEEVDWAHKGHRVGGKVLRKPARLAILSVGYYNGFGLTRPDREAGLWDHIRYYFKKPTVRIGGQKVKIVGRIGMTHTVVDVTKLECRPGDKAILDVDPVNVKGLRKVYR